MFCIELVTECEWQLIFAVTLLHFVAVPRQMRILPLADPISFCDL